MQNRTFHHVVYGKLSVSIQFHGWITKARRGRPEKAELMGMASRTSCLVSNCLPKLFRIILSASKIENGFISSRLRSEKVSIRGKERHLRVPEHLEDIPKHPDCENSTFRESSGAYGTAGLINRLHISSIIKLSNRM